ncbi:hypothetical protein NPIL_647701 [Nephila pilipes]|uniref:Uncharacterized protein n=1 Tax=Nephila pilipes TaxID=299642 RepID=A0A8X6QAT0_NEPPI|nr:hypothetical protein NPIL_647701 [Nephila pilipes]
MSDSNNSSQICLGTEPINSSSSNDTPTPVVLRTRKERLKIHLLKHKSSHKRRKALQAIEDICRLPNRYAPTPSGPSTSNIPKTNLLEKYKSMFPDLVPDCSSLPEPPVETTTIIVETVLSSTPDFKSQTPSIPRGQQSSSTSPHLLHQIERSQPDASAAKVSSTPSSLSVLQDNYSSPTILIEPSAGVLQPVSTPSPQSLTSKSSSQIITQVPTFTDLPSGLSDPTLLSFQPKPQRQ